MAYPVTLDALVSRAISSKTGNFGDSIYSDIPLAQEDGIFKASSLLMPRFFHTKDLKPERAIATKEVYFFGVGEPDAVVQLLRDYVPCIGRHTGAGYGKIARIYWRESPDYSWRLANGSPARPLPLPVWISAGGNKNQPCAMMAVRPPYWRSPLFPSVFPAFL